MRNVINISLPSDMTRLVEKEVKAHQFASKSEFFRHLIREWQHKELVNNVRESQKEHHAGKSKKLRSPSDLWK